MVRSVELLGSESNGGRRWKDRREKYSKWVQKTQGCQHRVCERWKALTPWFISSVSQWVWIEHLPCAAQSSRCWVCDGGQKCDASRGPWQRGCRSVTKRKGNTEHLPETWGKETGVSAEWERERGSGRGRKMCKHPGGMEEQVKVVEALEARRESLD